jgi:hypothetical protein
MDRVVADCGSSRQHKVLIANTALLLYMLSLSSNASAQVQLDWNSRPKDPKQSVSLPGQQISKTQLVTFSLMHVNDVFYDYSMTCTKVPSESVDFSGIIKLATGGARRKSLTVR